MTVLTREQILAGLGQRVRRTRFIAALGGAANLGELGRTQLRQAGELSKNGKNESNSDLWHLAIIAFGVVDEDGAPLFTFDELRALAEGDDPPLRPMAAQQLAQEILDLSEVGPEWLKSGGPETDAG